MDKKIRCVYRANLINRHSVREKEGRHDIWHDFSIPFLPSEHSGAMKLGMLKLIYFLIDRETNAFGGAKYRDRPSPFLFFFSFPQSWRSRIFNPYFFHIHSIIPSPFLENRQAAPRSWKKQIESEGWRMGGRTLTMKFLFVRWSKFVRHVLKRKAIPPFKSF